MTDRPTPRVPPQRGAGDVALPLELQLVLGPGLGIPVRACLRYHPAEPYAVYLDLHVALDAPITWVFARELLATGLTEGAGPGDVSIRPGADGSPQTVDITLHGADSATVLRAPARQVRTFLAGTERVVPFGSEDAHLDLDGLPGWLRGDEPPEPGS
ncbi:SsgA family sporulation/cell division regulator [Kitasatospora nipponensis]|uniref:SsgA family sporulation/cell division regulator n=1 Tax=Kitasatospora nipponensis TaxID=258049 RepID=A0ABP4HHE5_9ACTN